ncbi:MAG: cellulose biosynthesis cyclic di-GMP-binding regulatory protein BcsB, partial [Tepidanaerobacteraceae bacterium]|nr:cellulose biosynthesis cyclic di-GMP-binding regulatory protein BcsB [Tepidanaerobacteraceae bacterium]
IKGIFWVHNIFFLIDKHWKIKSNCDLELIFRQSEIKKYKNSTLTVYLNDLPIKSITLQDKENFKTVEKISLPKEQITQGYNFIKFSTYHRVTEESCTDDLNPANWLVFHKESFIHLEYEEILDKIGISDYPYPYLKTSALELLDCTILVPDKPTQGQMSAAMIIAADFGRRVPYDNIDVKVMQYKDIENVKENTNLIIIGGSTDRENKLLEPIRKELSKLNDKGIIKEIASPKEIAKRILYLVSDKDEMLIMAAKTLTWDKLVFQMKGDTQFISEIYIRDEESEKNSTKVTLKDLGYEDTVIKGIFNQQATYVINIPKNRKLKGEPFIQIPLRYSKALDFDKSSVSVYLNNIPVADKLLDENKAEADEIKVNIPKEFWEENSLELKLLFYLEPHSFDCRNWRHGDIWALVSKNTSFNIPQETIEDRYFQNYPGLFIKNGTFNDLLVVLPEKIDRNYLTLAANTLAFIGHSINKVDNITVITSSDFENTDKNIIMIGTPQDNGSIKNLNDKLHIKFDKNFDRFQANDKIYFIDDYSRNLSSIQLLPSPFNTKKHMMVVTGTGQENMMAAEVYLKKLEFNGRLSGDGVVIDSDGDIQSAYFTKSKGIKFDEGQNSQRPLTKWHENPQLVTYVIFFLMIILISIYGVIVVIRGKE